MLADLVEIAHSDLLLVLDSNSRTAPYAPPRVAKRLYCDGTVSPRVPLPRSLVGPVGSSGMESPRLACSVTGAVPGVMLPVPSPAITSGASPRSERFSSCSVGPPPQAARRNRAGITSALRMKYLRMCEEAARG